MTRTPINEIIDYIAPLLREPEHAEAIARDILAAAEAQRAHETDRLRCELPSRYTLDGRPAPFEIAA